MGVTDEPFYRANDMCRRRAYQQWHRSQSKQQILRSQVGFQTVAASYPRPCQGCTYYHGIAYGTHRDRRTVLICAMHPHGWQRGGGCPDWRGEAVESSD